MKLKYIVLLCICLTVAVVCATLNFTYQRANLESGKDLEEKLDSIKQSVTTGADTNDEYRTTDVVQPEETSCPDDTAAESEADTTVDTTQSLPTVSVPGDIYGTMDFQALWDVNPEICAWMEIEGTEIDYPVLQSAENDKRYLNTAYDGSPYIGGAIFTEKKYNSNDFNDPVTLIYGHTMRSGNLFGRLQKTYSSKDSFQKHSRIIIYLPDEVRTYTVFAAVPYSKIHILNTYDFSNEYWYNRFFKEVGKIREIGANFNDEISPEYGDRVIILSVCLNSDTTRRYLVMAVSDGDLADNSY